jgi:hypothetical protein
MNAFTQAHAMTKEIIQAGDNYAATFALCLKHINKKVNPMIDMIDGMIADSKAYIGRLEAFNATGPKGYIVVTGEGRICVAFEGDTCHTTNTLNATRYNDLQIAKAKGRQVQNGKGEKGRAVYVTEQIEWEISQQNILIAQLTEAKKNHK